MPMKGAPYPPEFREEAVCLYGGGVGEAKENAHGIFHAGDTWDKVGLGRPRFLSSRIWMAPVVPSIHATLI